MRFGLRGSIIYVPETVKKDQTMTRVNRLLSKAILASAVLGLGSGTAFAACKDVNYDQLSSVGRSIVPGNGAAGGTPNGGLDFPMWVTVVDENSKICHVVNTFGNGANTGSTWLLSRVISAQKANTANGLSTDNFAISTAMLYSEVNPGGSLYGLQHSNPVDATRAYGGSPNAFGTKNDPLKNKRIGGVNVFGGGLALYKDGKKVGAIGVSGDTSCTDHIVAWNIRAALNLGGTPNPDTLNVEDTPTPGNFSHPPCLNLIEHESITHVGGLE